MSCVACKDLNGRTFTDYENNPPEDMIKDIKQNGYAYMYGLTTDTKEPAICVFHYDKIQNRYVGCPMAAQAYYCLICGEKLR